MMASSMMTLPDALRDDLQRVEDGHAGESRVPRVRVKRATAIFRSTGPITGRFRRNLVPKDTAALRSVGVGHPEERASDDGREHVPVVLRKPFGQADDPLGQRRQLVPAPNSANMFWKLGMTYASRMIRTTTAIATITAVG
jgi:hypothetical protein